MSILAFNIQHVVTKSGVSEFETFFDGSQYGNWPMFHCDERNTGYSGFETNLTALTQPHLIWSYDLPSEVYSSPVVSDVDNDGHKEIFIDNGPIESEYGGQLSCFDESGQLEWIFNATHPIVRYTTVAVGDIDQNGYDEIMYWSSDGGGWEYPQALYCLEPNGTVRWKYAPKYGLNTLYTSYGIPTIANVTGSPQLETVVQHSINGDLYCISHTGGKLWKYEYAWIHGGGGGLLGDLWHAHVAPAIADLNNDSLGEIVVSMGWWNTTDWSMDGAIFW